MSQNKHRQLDGSKTAYKYSHIRCKKEVIFQKQACPVMQEVLCTR